MLTKTQTGKVLSCFYKSLKSIREDPARPLGSFVYVIMIFNCSQRLIFGNSGKLTACRQVYRWNPNLLTLKV